MDKLRILICDDMEHVRSTHEHRIKQISENIFFPEMDEAPSAEKALLAIGEAVRNGAPFDLILMDVDFSQSPERGELNGFQAANRIHAIWPNSVIVLISAHDTEDNLVLAERSPWVERFFRRDSFHKAELFQMCLFALVRKLHAAESLVAPSESIYSCAPVMESYLRQVDHISAQQNVVIFGESGTGKEMTAKRLNANARIALGQKTRPLVSINCGGLTSTLLTNELFGYVAGAFTGANRDTPGLLEKAEGGDVFLDELQNAPIGLQDLLMRVLNDNQFTPVGGKAPKKLNVRFITALNQDPVKATQAGTLKPDLLPRIQQSYLVIPPLRDRREDFPGLIERFLKLNASADKSLTPEAVQYLSEQKWPTNVRGLHNVLREAIRQSKTPMITHEIIESLKSFQDMQALSETPSGRPDQETGLGPKIEELASAWLESSEPLEEVIKAIERKVFTTLLKKEYTMRKIAARTQMSPTTVRRKLSEYELS